MWAILNRKRRSARFFSGGKSPSNYDRTAARMVEALEARRLLSGSLNTADLEPALTTGLSWSYQTSGTSTSTQTTTVIGPTTFNGNSVIETDGNVHLISPITQDSLVQSYFSYTADGFVEYATTTTVNGTTLTDSFDSGFLELPPTLTPGVPASGMANETITVEPGDIVDHHVIGVTYTLQSLTTQPMSVPAGPYDTYEVDSSNTQDGLVVSNAQFWYAMNVGVVKSIVTTQSGAITEELTAINGNSSGTGGTGGTGGNGDTGTLTGTLNGSLPASVVAGAAFKGKATLTLTATAAVSGPISEAVYLSPTTNVADKVLTLFSGQSSLKLTSGKSKTIHLRLPKSIPSSAIPGFYDVLVVTTDAAGSQQTTAQPTVTIVAPQVDLSGSVLHVPTTTASAKKVPLTFTITNTVVANVPAAGTIQISFASSPDGLLNDETALTSIAKHISLKPGKSLKMTMKLSLSATGYIIVDVDPANTAFPNDENQLNNIIETSTPITVS